MAIWRATPKPKARDFGSYALRDLTRDQAHLWRLGRGINASLREDRQQRTEEAVKDIERILGADLPPTQSSLAPDEGVV